MSRSEPSTFLTEKKAEFLAAFKTYAARVSQNLKRCKETHYDVTLKRTNNEVGALDRKLPEEIWLGAGV